MRVIHAFWLHDLVGDNWPHVITRAARQTIEEAHRLHVDPTDLTMWIDNLGDIARVSFIGEHVCTGDWQPDTELIVGSRS